MNDTAKNMRHSDDFGLTTPIQLETRFGDKLLELSIGSFFSGSTPRLATPLQLETRFGGKLLGISVGSFFLWL